MAPTQPTSDAPTTRSIARKNGVTHHALNAGVYKRFQCIICDKKHGSRAALSRHFKSHTTRPVELSPFTHPSCWDDAGATHPPSRQRVHDMMIDDDEFEALPLKKQRALNTKIKYAEAGVKNKKQLKQKDDQAHLRLLHWFVLPQPIMSLFKPIGNRETSSRDSRAPPECIILTWRKSTGGSEPTKIL